ncbi:tumor necrosis factor alpha-induced protein 3-like isoform X1 [Hemiscyllium ocellatum]|uniref:tumor necrosis factor alpha-induced protein 3-like isoform X1 n=1 Tax=Hemiscyllium ocellatum TaxID=170820 RepID=UPI00296610FA|nr:tumor necrosis factor alpha-induced protein 3-like isoform X1 [Hemiscyllium ocellatum]
MKAVELRAVISEDIVRPTSAKPFIHHLNKLHEYTLQLCSTRGYQRKFRRMVEQALFDEEIYKTLQEARVLNWCREVRKQFPLKVPGEGNSLLHSISLYMWGVQDTDLVLQKTFHEALVKAHDANFKLRFQTEYRTDQGFLDPALLHQPKIWDQEWQNVIESSNPGSPAGHPLANIYQDVHIFVLANIVRRPIVVVVGNSKGSSKSVSERMTSSPAGIYLPLHWPPHLCYSYPILLSYAHQYFTPLISVNDVGPEINAFPLAVPSEQGSVELPIRFLLDAEKCDRKQVLSSYLLVVPLPDCHGGTFVDAVRLYINPLPDDLNLVQDYFQLVNHQYKFWQQNTDKERSGRNEDGLAFLANLSIVGDKCLTPGCTYFCSKFTKPFCHTCRDAFRKTDVPSGANNCKQSDGQGDNVKELESKGTTLHGLKDIRKTPSTPPQPAPPLSAHSSFCSENNALKCKTSHCPFTGNVTMNGLCPSCFQERSGHIPEEGSNSSPKAAGEFVEEEMDLWGERCNSCKQVIRTFNGLCFSCSEMRDSLSKSQSRTKQTPSGSLQAAMAKIGNYGPLVPQGQRQLFSQLGESAKCKNQNCQYFGTEEQNGFCTTCFFRYVEEIEASAQQDPNQHVNHSPTAPNGNLAQISSHLKNMSVCCKAECSMLANPVYSGYCEKCYVYAQSKHAQRIKSGRDIPADQHIWSPVLPRCHNYNASNDQGLSDRTTNELFEVELVTSSNSSSGHLQSSQIRTFSSSDQQNLETRRKLCRTQDCENFGNAKCDGYCNACFTTLQMHRK